MVDPFIEFTPSARVLSPCILVCTLDPETGWCLGCGRTGEEIALWSETTDTRRQEILDALPERLKRLEGG